MWGSWVKLNWIGRVINRCYDFPHNNYVFQSKNPKRFSEWFVTPKANIMLGTTIETDHYWDWNFKSGAPSIEERYNGMLHLPKGTIKFITIEPIMDFHLKSLMDMIRNIHPHFVTIGADSKGHGLNEPSWEKVEALIVALGKEGIEIRQKTNLDRLKKMGGRQ